MGELSQTIQIAIALGFSVILFLLAFVLPVRVAVACLICLIPFQIVDSQYGSLNMVATYVLFAALLVKGQLSRPPLILITLVMFTWYLVSLAFAARPTWFEHATYMVSFASNFLLAIIAFSYFRRQEQPVEAFARMMTWLGCLTTLYCLLRLVLPDADLSLFGLTEFSARSNLIEKQRLNGPFDAPGPNGTLYTMLIFSFTFFALFLNWRRARLLWILLITLNLGFLIATGSRGSFLVLIGGIPLFLMVFRRALGLKRIMLVVVGGALISAVSMPAILYLTDFNILFDRLSETKIEGGFAPDTRKLAWEETVENFPPLLSTGFGPRFRTLLERPVVRQISYPHNLYLFIGYTVGWVGLIIWGGFILNFWLACRKGLRAASPLGDNELLLPTHFVQFGILLSVLFMVDQIKISFLRAILFDFQHFVFLLIGTVLGIAAFLGDQRQRSDASM